MKIYHSDPDAVEIVAKELRSALEETAAGREIVYVCIGTDRSTGDALGPLVGTTLKQSGFTDVYGTLDDPVHAENMNKKLEGVRIRHENPFIIAVDACLGQISSVGSIEFKSGPIKPGAGVSKELPPVGDYHLAGIVNVGGFMEYFVLQNTRLSLVMKMAEVISNGITTARMPQLAVVSA